MSDEKLLKRYYITIIKATIAYINRDEKEITKQNSRLLNVEKQILKRMKKD